MNRSNSPLAAVIAVCMGMTAMSVQSAELPGQFHGSWAPDCQSPDAAMLGMDVQADMVFRGIEECSVLKATPKGKGLDVDLECMVMLDVTDRKLHWEPAANGTLVESDLAKPGQSVNYRHCP